MRKRSSVASIECEHVRHRIAVVRGEIADVVAAVAVLRRLLPKPRRVDRRAEEVELAAGVVVVVLALDIVARVREEPRDGVAVRAVPCRRRRGSGRSDSPTPSRRSRAPALWPSRSRSRSSTSLSASARNPSVTKRLRKPGPATSARSTSASSPTRRRQLLGDLARRAPPNACQPHRDVRRVVAVRRIGRPLELELGSGQLGDRRGQARERSTGQQPCSARRSPRACGSPPACRRRSARRPARSARRGTASYRTCRRASAARR